LRQKKVLVSACLLGERCRYDGATKQVNEVINAFEGWEIIPFCPEAPVLGTPRERISVVNTDEGLRVIADESGRDVTDLLIDETESAVLKNSELHQIVLKSKSPSCGLGTTPVLDEARQTIGFGDGIAASLLKDAFPKVGICDETHFKGE
jgi:uncharacterized protein YbbK (DUF523 family)